VAEESEAIVNVLARSAAACGQPALCATLRDVVGRRRAVVFVVFGSMAGCAAILGREDIVFDEDTLRPDSSDDRTTSTPDVTPVADVNTADVNDAGPTCPGVDASCDTDANADAGCCSGLECRNARCSTCIALNGGCVQGGNTRCCGTAVCGQANVCIPCLEAGVTCSITDPQFCCSKQCSPVNGCF
jgi:hypothetical protein